MLGISGGSTGGGGSGNIHLPIRLTADAEDNAVGSAVQTFRMPFTGTLTGVAMSCATAPTGSVLTVDINKNGTTMLSTKLTIDATEKTSTTAATAAVISVSAFTVGDEITADFDGVGSSVPGKGTIVYLKCTEP